MDREDQYDLLTAALLGVAVGEAERARREGLGAEELARARSFLAGLYPLRLETNEQIAGAMAELHLFDLPESWVAEYRSRLAAVTDEEANEAARRWFFAEPFSLVIVGDEPSIRRGLEAAGIEGELAAVPIEELE